MSHQPTVSAADIEEYEVADLLSGLVERSLVVLDEATGRYRLLETVRQFAGDRLMEEDEVSPWRDRHLDFYTQLGQAAEPHLAGGDQQEWLERLNAEHDNLRTALAWGRGAEVESHPLRVEIPETATARSELGTLNSQLSTLNSQQALRLAGAIWRFWYVRGHFTEGRQRLAELLSIADPGGSPAARAGALTGAGVLAWCQGDYNSSRALFEEGLALRRELGDRAGIATLLNNLGNVAYDQADYDSARSLFEESLALRRELEDQRGIAATLNNLGNVVNELGDYAAARELFEESLEIKQELGDRWSMAHSLSNLGNASFNQGDYPAARALIEESLAIRRELGDQSGIALSLNNLGNVALAEDDPARAAAIFRESLAIKRTLGDRWGICFSFEGLAAAEADLGRKPSAARLWGAAERLREEISAPIPLTDRSRLEQKVAESRAAAKDVKAFDAAWQEGRAMTLEQAMEYALTTRQPNDPKTQRPNDPTP